LEEPDSSTETAAVVTIHFTCELERHDREQFQKEGHFVAGIEGPEVFILTLRDEDVGQLLRIQAGTKDKAVELMGSAILAEWQTIHRAKAVQGFDYQQFLNLNRDRNHFALWIAHNYAEEIESGRFGQAPDPYLVAVAFLRKERTRVWARLRRWWYRRSSRPVVPELPADGDVSLPEEWRK
jgi:hypothetical protein